MSATDTATSHQPLFSGLWIALVTPFRDGAVDHPALAALTTRLRADGVAGFVACGSTGEAPALDKAEQLQVLETVLSGDAMSGVECKCSCATRKHPCSRNDFRQ